ncbi:MAG: polysaccharide biosynthesis protein [Acidobacteria bacterium]|nr:polysaccharide biosynthesis protein [Acidobacteriota bacterium]
MKPEAILLIYGEGGHKAQMVRLLSRLLETGKCSGVQWIGLCENKQEIKSLTNFSLLPVRDKHSRKSTICNIPGNLWLCCKFLAKIQRTWKVKGVISTGPAIAILPSLFFKLLGARIVFIETWCRFETRSWTGRAMYRIADRFYIQNDEQKQYYSGAIFGGLL